MNRLDVRLAHGPGWRRLRAAAIIAATLLALLGATRLVRIGHRDDPAGAAPLPPRPFSAAPAPVGPSPTGAGVGRSTAAPAVVTSTGAVAERSPLAPSMPAMPAMPVEPDHVYVPSLGIIAPIVPERVTGNELGIPPDVATVGIDVDAAELDGAVGTVLLAGHVDYVGQGDGAFYPLSRVQPHMTIWVSDDRARLTRWQVSALADPVKADLDQTIFDRDGPRRLVLVTCGGQVHHGSYDRNVVVYATPVPT